MNILKWALLAVVAVFVLRQVFLRRGVVQIRPSELQERLAANGKVLVVDVREPGEFRQGHIPGAVSVPLSSLDKGAAKLERDAEIALVCASGNRSLVAYQRLKAQGFTNLRNVPGGMSAWGGPTDRK